MLKFDHHIHSVYSGDSRSEPKDILDQAEKVGLDVIAISDHNTIKGSQMAFKIAKEEDRDIIVIPSIEISTDKGHMIGLGVTKNIPKGLSAIETADRIHENGGLVVIPHPFSFYRHGLFCNIEPNLMVDAVETKNARYIAGRSNKLSKDLAFKNRLSTLGGSDSHFIESIGDAYTEVNTYGDHSITGVLEAIKHRRCTAIGKRTSAFLIGKEVFIKKVLKKYPKREDYIKGL